MKAKLIPEILFPSSDNFVQIHRIVSVQNRNKLEERQTDGRKNFIKMLCRKKLSL